MSIRNKTAALLIAAVTFSSGLAVLPAGTIQAVSAEAAGYQISVHNAPVVKTTYTSTESSITISWNKVSGATGYYVYRWSEKAPAWVRVGSAKSASSAYTDVRVATGESYKYYVVAYLQSGSRRILSGRSNAINASTLPGRVSIQNLTATKDSMKVTWSKVNGTGYEVYYQKSGGEWKLASKINSSSTTNCEIKNLSHSTKYNVKIRVTAKDPDGKVLYGQYCPTKSVTTETPITFPSFTQYRRSSQHLIDRLNSATLKSGQSSYYEYDRQYATETKTKITISAEDKEIMKAFADANFTSSMTAGEKVDYTLQWLHYKVVYADGINGRPDYMSIWNLSCVNASFVQRAGQCLQYNTALCAMMRYLGYDANVVKGWRGNSITNKWQHYWCEVNINGTKYVMDTYNVNDDSNGNPWYFLCATYAETRPYSNNSHYIMNNTLMSPKNGYTLLNDKLKIMRRGFGSR